MNKIKVISSTIMPIDIKDVDTDMLIPAQFLTSTSKEGYGEHLFARLRQMDPEFPLNQDKYDGAEIMLSGVNFGCGSSREHAVWALQQAGFKAIIAPSFSDIFYNNACKCGLVLIQMPKDWVQQWIKATTTASVKMRIDIHSKTISINAVSYTFEMDSFYQHCFLNGLDEMDYLLEATA